MNTRECIKCNNCTVDKSDNGLTKIVCHVTGKVFCYGQFVNCKLKNNSRNRKRGGSNELLSK